VCRCARCARRRRAPSRRGSWRVKATRGALRCLSLLPTACGHASPSEQERSSATRAGNLERARLSPRSDSSLDELHRMGSEASAAVQVRRTTRATVRCLVVEGGTRTLPRGTSARHLLEAQTRQCLKPPWARPCGHSPLPRGLGVGNTDGGARRPRTHRRGPAAPEADALRDRAVSPSLARSHDHAALGPRRAAPCRSHGVREAAASRPSVACVELVAEVTRRARAGSLRLARRVPVVGVAPTPGCAKASPDSSAAVS
jgi:hypothetical protein